MITKNSLKNLIATSITNILNLILGMISTTLFIRYLNIEYRGINGLFSNIISMLSIAELGISNAIIVNLYKPIREKDTEKIKSLIYFYKKTYNIIIVIMLSLGILIIPFLKYIIKDITVPVNITLAYILMLLSAVCSYILAHKRTILYASQKDYILKIISIIYLFICNFSQIIALYLTKNYYTYLIIKVICQILENITISLVADKEYKFLKDKNYTKLDKQTEKNIWKKVKGLSIHKISNFIVSGTDNIIISSFLGVISVGLYSNYSMIINNIKNVSIQIMSSFQASIGDLIAENNPKNNFEAFKKIRFFNLWLALFTSVCLLIITQDFIKLWIGKEYLLTNQVLIILVLNYYQSILQRPYKGFKDAAGIWIEDKFIPILEAILNIIISLILLKKFGLVGIFWGTFISSLTYWSYSYPKFIYKGIFNKSYLSYIKNIILYLLLFILIATTTHLTTTLFTTTNIILKLIIDIIICCIIPNIILIILFHKTKEFKYFINLLKKLIKILKNKKQSI